MHRHTEPILLTMASRKTTQRYTADAIEVLSGLDPVKRRPGMYTDTARPNHLAHEVIDNSVDEAIGGFANHITVTVHKDNSLSVEDNGRGIPIGIHPDHKIPGIELIFTRLHAGAKFSNKTYKYSGGLHGVGISVVNALSKKLIAEVRHNKKRYQMEFAHGAVTTDLHTIGRSSSPQTGTSIRFWPAKQYFDNILFSTAALKQILCAKAVLCPGLLVEYQDENSKESLRWHYEEGLKTYLSSRLSQASCCPPTPWVGAYQGDTEEVSWALTWQLDPMHDNVHESYVNLIPTPQGGTHVTGFRAGILEAMREFCQLHKLLSRQIKLTGDDVWEPCQYVISVKMQEPQFSGQTKERLSSRQSSAFVSGVVKDAFSLWLNHHVDLGKQLAELAIARANKRLRDSKKIDRKKIAYGPALPGKLADCIEQNVSHSELFLVEGDSAGGSAKQARDKNFQAVLPLRGKILNTWEVDSDHILKSETIHDIAIGIGADPGSDDLNGLRYGKICILADADSDGHHIAALLCALFMRHFQPLILAGHIYVALPPLYRIDVGKKVFYALSDKEKENFLKKIKREKIKGHINIQRFKGLGEMNPSQLRETTIHPNSRRLVQLTLENTTDAAHTLDMLLAKKRSADRRQWLEKMGHLAD